MFDFGMGMRNFEFGMFEVGFTAGVRISIAELPYYFKISIPQNTFSSVRSNVFANRIRTGRRAAAGLNA